MATHKLPGVLSFARRIDVGDGIMSNLYKDGSTTPVDVIEHGIRGTQNADGGSKNVSNIQVTQSAKLDANASALLVSFPMHILPVSEGLNAIAPAKGDKPEAVAAFRDELRDFLTRVSVGRSAAEMSRRIARNVLNGRWLWRNRTKAAEIEVRVYQQNAPTPLATSSAVDLPLNHFDQLNENELALAGAIQEGLEKGRVALRIEATVNFGVQGSIELNPSEEYIPSKPQGRARMLYAVDRSRATSDGRVVGTAAIRDAKIGNALRTVDTWYPGAGDQPMPTPIEPNGASLKENAFLRDGAASAYKILPKLNALAEGSNEEIFVLGCILRGGVLSGKKEA